MADVELAAAAEAMSPEMVINFADQFQNNLDTINIQVSRLELVFKRRCCPLSSAWEAFLGYACRDNMTQKGLLDENTCSFLAQDMYCNITDESLQRICLALIDVLCHSHETNQKLMGDMGMVSRVVKAMRVHRRCAEVQLQGLRAMLSLCRTEHSRNESNVNRAWECRALSIISKTLEAHREEPEVQKLGRKLTKIFLANTQQNDNTQQADGGRCRKRARCDSESSNNSPSNSNSDHGRDNMEDDEDADNLNDNNHHHGAGAPVGRNCSVCLDNASTHAFIPCGHLCACVGCVERIRNLRDPSKRACPICRTPYKAVQRIFSA